MAEHQLLEVPLIQRNPVLAPRLLQPSPCQDPRSSSHWHSESAHTASMVLSGSLHRLQRCSQAVGMPTFVKTRQMWTSAATPTMETRTFLSLAALTASITLPGSQVESAANKISTCVAMCFHALKGTLIESS